MLKIKRYQSISLSLLVLAILFIFVAEPKFPKKIYRFSKSLFNEYAPSYSQNALDSVIQDKVEINKREALDAFLPHINKEMLDLTLIKQPAEEFVRIKGQEFEIYKYRANFLNLVKRVPEKGPAYIGIQDNNLFIVQENGLFFKAPKDDFLSKKHIINAKVYDSNITNFVNYFEFFAPGQFGIKDILIIKNKIYVSYIRERKPGCFNTSILESNIEEKLEFSIFFSPLKCIKEEMQGFNAHQSGGRLAIFKENKILFSVGEYRSRLLAQELGNPFGKILSIDLNSNQMQEISIGHRNPQGLYYSEKYNDIFSTEHGPNGGDELNHNLSPNSKNIKNFGWPIASYGGHYGGSQYELINEKLELKENREIKDYESAPLHKNHEQYDFIEPLLYFSPSVGISQIIEVDKNFLKFHKDRTLIFGTMGYATSSFIPSLSLFVMSLNSNNNLSTEKQIALNERIRDLIFDTDSQSVFFSGDSNGVIGIFKEIKK
jgi:hypothetical protein